jgi:parvulin-like peptidyl-prolyl isomerase
MDSRTRRSLILCAAGAALGLMIAGYGLFTAPGTRFAGMPTEDAAVVNGVPILRSDVIQQLSALYGVSLARSTPDQRRKVLDDLIREEIYVQRGVEMGLANDEVEVRQALVSATESKVAQDAMTTRPSEQELSAWYSSHRPKYATEGVMLVREWLLPRSGDAARAVAVLRAGGSPQAAGLRTSGRVDDGEEFYFAAKIHLGERLFAVAARLSDGQVSDPIEASDGTHIIQMVRNTKPVAIPFDQVRDRVLQDFLADKIARLQAGNERFLRRRADIRIADDLR